MYMMLGFIVGLFIMLLVEVFIEITNIVFMSFLYVYF